MKAQISAFDPPLLLKPTFIIFNLLKDIKNEGISTVLVWRFLPINNNLQWKVYAMHAWNKKYLDEQIFTFQTTEVFFITVHCRIGSIKQSCSISKSILICQFWHESSILWECFCSMLMKLTWFKMNAEWKLWIFHNILVVDTLFLMFNCLDTRTKLTQDACFLRLDSTLCILQNIL